MFYIPDNWLKDVANRDKVHVILEKYLYTDLVPDNDDGLSLLLSELEGLGELIILKKVKDGTLRIN